MYILWSTKLQGWLTHAGNYSTICTDALQLDRTAALLYCRKHKTAGSYGLLPVAVADMEAI